MPKVGLALGSGGARGWAHLGALRRLNELGFRPHCVCGASIGALIGSIYAAGHLQAFEDFASSFGWKDLVDLFFSPTFNTKGILSGDRVVEFLRRPEMLGTGESKTFVPFTAVATNLHTGKVHYFSPESNLLHAVRASIAIPVLFTPHRVNGVSYIDGGLTDPLPVNACRKLGADIVIAIDINLNTPSNLISDSAEKSGLRPPALKRLFGRKRSNEGVTETNDTATLLHVMASTIRIMEDTVTRDAIAIQKPEVLVQPAVGHFHLLAFKEARLPAIQAGYEAILAIEPQLRRLGMIAPD